MVETSPLSGAYKTSAHDGSWHDKLVLITDLVAMNKKISAYVLRTLDADARRAAPMAVADERALGLRLIDLGSAIQFHADQHDTEPGHDSEPHLHGGPPRIHPRETRTPWSDCTTAIYATSSE
ncbi:hypothetical protein GCM10027436_09910 [Actinophytocola sediminis]